MPNKQFKVLNLFIILILLSLKIFVQFYLDNEHNLMPI